PTEPHARLPAPTSRMLPENPDGNGGGCGSHGAPRVPESPGIDRGRIRLRGDPLLLLSNAEVSLAPPALVNSPPGWLRSS
ncbi:hypothetical protein BRADI_2g05955v3, partial [Brachypodium distachyon]